MLVIRGRRLVFPDGERAASLHIDGGRIVAVGGVLDQPSGADVVDCGSLLVSAGLVDSHVHINDPGRADWEGFETATRAAAAGGITTLVDMPLNSIPPTTTVAGLEAKRRALRRCSDQAGKCRVNVEFWGGVVPDNERDIEPLIDAGVRGFKCFLVPSGVDEFAPVGEDTLRRVMPALARRDVPLLVHAELAQHLRAHEGDAGSYRAYEATRPPLAEVSAIETMASLSRATGARVHVVHVSSAQGVEAIARAQASGIRLTGESCPHYLTIAGDEIPDGATEFKCAPPIRSRADRDALWGGLKAGSLSLVATDHSPSPPALKSPGDFVTAWGGIASLELSLPVVWTEARRRGFTAVDLTRWMSAAPAALAGLSAQTGRLAAGMSADLVVWDPDASFVVQPELLQQRHKLTPYAGRRLSGIVHTTYVRGERVWQR